MKFKPHQDRILIKPTPPDKFRGGIELLDAEDKTEGTVIAVGTGVPLHNIHLNVTGDVSEAAMDKLLQVVKLIEKGREMAYQPGDYVIYGRYAGTKITYNGEEHILIRDGDVFGHYQEEHAERGAGDDYPVI